MQTQNFAMPQPPHADRDQPRRRGRGEELPRRRAARGRRRAAAGGARRAVRARGGSTGWPTRLHGVRARRCGALDAPRAAVPRRDPLRASPTTAIVVADMCIPGYWLAGFHTPAHPRRLQIPLGWGTLGYAFPAALGAALADARARSSRSPATAASSTRCGELATVAQEQIPLTLVIVDDGGYGMLRYDQDVERAPTATASTWTRPTSRRWRRAFGIRAADGRRARRRRSAPRSPSTCRPGAERARRAHARAARAAAEHLAELVPAQQGAGARRSRSGSPAHHLGERAAGRRRRPPSSGSRTPRRAPRPSRWPRAPTPARRARRAGRRAEPAAARRRGRRPTTSRCSPPGSSRPTRRRRGADRQRVEDARRRTARSRRSTARARRCATRWRTARSSATDFHQALTRAAARRPAVVVQGLREPPRAPVAVAGDRHPRRAGRRRPRRPRRPCSARRRPRRRRRPGGRARAPLPAGARRPRRRCCSLLGELALAAREAAARERAGELAEVDVDGVGARRGRRARRADADGRAAAPEPRPAGEREDRERARARPAPAQADLDAARRPGVALVDGEVAGLWRPRKKGKRLVVERRAAARARAARARARWPRRPSASRRSAAARARRAELAYRRAVKSGSSSISTRSIWAFCSLPA